MSCMFRFCQILVGALFLVAFSVEAASRELSAPQRATIKDIASGRHHLQKIHVEGIVEDIVPDDIDPNWQILILRDGGDTVLVPLRTGRTYERLIDARIAVTGRCDFSGNDTRSLFGWRVLPKDDKSLEIIETSKAREDTTPHLPSKLSTSPEATVALGRRQVVGTVLAVWRGNLLVRDDNGLIRRIETSEADAIAVGARVRAIGQVETDLFRLNLSSARVRTLTTSAPTPAKTEKALSVKDIYDNRDGRRAFKPLNSGRTIQLIGIVRSLPIEDIEGSRAILSCDGIDVPLDFYTCRSAPMTIPRGAKIAVRGVLVFETENWRTSKPLPRITGMFVSVAHADDVTILSTPSWWTPKRLLCLIGGLALALLIISVWNFSLRRLAERRGRALAAAGIAQAESDSRFAERTRLAVELHDSVSQNLTGAALAIRAARRHVSDETGAPLDIALRTVDATREELRNCIWDLRNRALEEPDFAAAIRRTLEPLVSSERIRIRFTVPRACFSDISAHTILCVIRELVANAIRHGHATDIAIAGAERNARIVCSVRDNGTGFDPETCPNMEQGHFGLQGIRERIKAFDGHFTIRSTPGTGTKAILSVALPHRNES